MAFDLSNYIMHHVSNSREWHVPFLPPIHLPEFITLHGLMVLITAGLMILTFCFLYNRKKEVPSGLTNALEVMVVFVRDKIAIPFIGEHDAPKMTPLLCTFFFFILMMNLLGLIPLFSAATGNVNVTASLALITLFVMIFGAIYKNGLIGFFKAFVPSGVPMYILPLIFVIEFAGMFIKTVALTIRLFANMMAGHIVIFALLGLVVTIGLVALPAVLMAVFIYLIEVVVAFLQAYIFTMLSAMFIGQVHHPEH